MNTPLVLALSLMSALVPLWTSRAAAADLPTTNTVSATNPPQPVLVVSRGVPAHDPSTIVKCKDEYWVFYSGRGVPSYHSKDLVKWERGPVVFTNTLAWATNAVPGNRRNDFWAPDVIHHGNQYYLYYSVSTFGRNTSAIGVATNPTLDPNDPAYHWTDGGLVIQSGPRDDFNTIDPAVTEDANGGLWLSFGSFWSGIKLIKLDSTSGKRITPDSTIYPLAHYNSIEASYIYRHGGHYYLFVNWGMCCRGPNSTYNIRIGRSDVITGPYRDKAGVDLLSGGGTLFLDSNGPLIGPGHAGIIPVDGTNWFSCHLESGTGTRAGGSPLAMGQLQWGPDDWPYLLPVN